MIFVSIFLYNEQKISIHHLFWDETIIEYYVEQKYYNVYNSAARLNICYTVDTGDLLFLNRQFTTHRCLHHPQWTIHYFLETIDHIISENLERKIFWWSICLRGGDKRYQVIKCVWFSNEQHQWTYTHR